MSHSLSNPSQFANTSNGELPGHTGYKIERSVVYEEDEIRQIALVYREAFAGPPYFEEYDEASVIEEVVIPHLPFCITVARLGGKIVGIACTHPLSAGFNTHIREYLLEKEDHFSFAVAQKGVYLSELAVLNEARGNGIGTRLTHECLSWAHENGYSHCLTRTAEEGSNSLRIFLRVGFSLLPFVQEFESTTVKSSSDRRVWLCRKTQPHQ